MAYGRVHRCPRLMLILTMQSSAAQKASRVASGSAAMIPELAIATIGMGDSASICERLRTLALAAAIRPAHGTKRIEPAVV